MKFAAITGALVVLVSTAGATQAAPKSGIRVVAGAKALTQSEKAGVNGLGGPSHNSNYNSRFDWGRGWRHKGWDNDCTPKPPPCAPPPCAPPPCVPPPCVPPPCVPPPCTPPGSGS